MKKRKSFNELIEQAKYAKREKPKPSKYRNIKIKKQGYTFDSILEYERFLILKDWAQKRKITELTLQPKYKIYEGCNTLENGKLTTVRPIHYIADFRYKNKNGETVVEDAKGVETEFFIMKKKMFISQLESHGVDEYRLVFEGREVSYV